MPRVFFHTFNTILKYMFNAINDDQIEIYVVNFEQFLVKSVRCFPLVQKKSINFYLWTEIEWFVFHELKMQI